MYEWNWRYYKGETLCIVAQSNQFVTSDSFSARDPTWSAGLIAQYNDVLAPGSVSPPSRFHDFYKYEFLWIKFLSSPELQA